MSSLAVVLAACLSLPARAQPPAAGPSAEAGLDTARRTQAAFRALAARIKPAVVSIDTVFKRTEQESPFFSADPRELLRRFFGEEKPDRERAPGPRTHHLKGIGSGVITDPRGYILTNEHVVGGARDIKVIVRSPEEKTYKGKVVGTDPTSDLAVVKIDADRPLPYAKLGDSDNVKVGDWAIAIGSPFGLEQTFTVGVISAERQALQVENRLYPNFIQTDASINMGNSGGPLLDIDGDVIGINTAIFTPTGGSAGIGFAIPSNAAADIMQQLIEKGRVVRGWAGVEIMPVNAVLARRFHVPEGKGALVNRVLPKSPAAKAGLRRGDVVVKFAGHDVASAQELTRAVADTPPGQKVEVRVIRDGRPQTLRLVTGERPREAAQEERPGQPAEPGQALSWLGAGLRSPDEELARRYALPEDAAGAVVVSVEPDSPADQMGLRPGDLIRALDGTSVDDAPAFLQAARRADLAKGVVLDVERRGRPLYLTYQKAR